MTGVVKEFPMYRKEPAVGASYHFMFPVEGTASKVTVPEPQTDEGVVEFIVGEIFTIAITAVRVGLLQPFAIAST